MKLKFKVQDPFKSVGMKLFVILFCSIVVLVSVLGYFSFTTSKGIIKDKVAASSSQTIIQTADKLDFLLGVYEGISRQLLTDRDLTGNLVIMSSSTDFNIKTRALITDKMNAIIAADKRLLSARLFKPEDFTNTNLQFFSVGSRSVSSSPEIVANIKKIADADGQVVWFPTKKKGFFNFNEEPTLTMGRLLKNAKNKDAQFILMLEVKDKAVTDMLSNVKIGDSGQFMIVGSDNKVVHAGSADLLESESTINIPADGTAEPGSYFSKDKQGHEQLVVYKQLTLNKWYMMGYVSVDQLVKETNKIFSLTLYIALAAVLVAIAIGYFLVRMVGRPLVKLCELMEQGEKGNLTVRTNFNSRDEIGRLGQSFNKMMNQISFLVENINNSASEVLDTAVELTSVSKTTSLAAKEIASATGEIAQGASDLALEAEQGILLTDNISQNMNIVIDSNTQMEASADRVQKISAQGTVYITELSNKTNTTEEMTRSMIAKVEKLKESTKSIRKILEVLNDMTKQTNILSLNATIEASRAGAAGKGFMVVANEIRRLADQSKESIKVVSRITDVIQTEVEETVAVLLAATPLFSEQISSMKEAASIFNHVRREMDDFLSRIEASALSINTLNESQSKLTGSISNVSAVSQQSSASSEEVAALSSEQLIVSEQLVGLSGKLAGLSEGLKKSLVTFHT